jgi:hypothetical protein
MFNVMFVLTGELRTGFWWGDPREGDHLKYPGGGERIILKKN